MRVHSLTGRLVKAGRIKSDLENKMLDLFRSQEKQKKKSMYVLKTAKSIYRLLPKAIQSIY